MKQIEKLIILIPGNPSVPGIYDPFLSQVIKDLDFNETIESRVLPHLGQCNERKAVYKKVNVHDVINDHRDSIYRLIGEHNPKQVILMGHSLGSAVTINLYEEFKTRVDHFIILCPFLGPSPNNSRYLKMFRNPITRLGMKGITYSALSNQVIASQIFKVWLGDNPFNKHIPKEIKKPLYLNHFFSLVGNYINDFESLQTKEKLQAMNPNHSFFVFAPKDYWVPEETIKYLPNDSNHILCKGINHDFCLQKSQYSKVSKAISNYLK